MYPHTHTHTCTNIQTHIHTLTDIHTHTHKHTQTDTNIHINTRTLLLARCPHLRFNFSSAFHAALGKLPVAMTIGSAGGVRGHRDACKRNEEADAR